MKISQIFAKDTKKKKKNALAEPYHTKKLMFTKNSERLIGSKNLKCSKKMFFVFYCLL